MQVRLEVTSGPSRGRSITLQDGDVALVGRAPWCNLIIGGDERCSRSHALVVVHPPHCHVRDLRSKHGTYVNGARIGEVASLSSGDRLRLGESEIAVEFIQPGVAAPQPPEAAAAESPSGPALRVQEPEGAAEEPTGREPLRFEESHLGERLAFEEDEEEIGEEEAGDGVVRCARCGQEPPAGSVRVPAGDGAPVFVCERCREEMRRAGEQVPGYRIIRLLNEGGMGRVWEAERLATGERVAIKTMIPQLATSRRGVRRFRREMRIAQQLQHPNIVRCIEAGEHQGLFYIVMELVAGEDAERRRQRQGGRLPHSEVVQIGVQALSAVEYAHRQGVIHRDLKPSNLLLVGDGSHFQVKVTDFGLARARGMSGITSPQDVLGTIPFMPPEQVLAPANVDARADIFGMGATLYHLLTSQFVFDLRPETEDVYVTIIQNEPVPVRNRRGDIPQAIAQVIDRAVQKDPRARFATAREMQQALEQVRGVW